MPLPLRLRRWIARFARTEAGGVTVGWILFFLTSVLIAGVAIDMSRLQAHTVLMQNTADNAAHAAMVTRQFNDEATAKQWARSVAGGNMPSARFGNVLSDVDVQFGTWNGTTRVFTPVANSTGAVRVTIRRTTASANPFRNAVVRLMGLRTTDVVRTAIVAGGNEQCLTEGFVSQQEIDIQSGNAFRPGFCIHSNVGVKMSSGNAFPDTSRGFRCGTVRVTAPTLSAITYQSNNTCIAQAIGTDRFNIPLLTRLPQVIQSLRNPNSSFISNAILTSRNVRNLPGSGTGNRKINSTLQSGVYIYDGCAANNTLSVETSLRNVVIVTNCQIKLTGSIAVESSILATTNTDANNAVSGVSGVRIGVLDTADPCSPGGGAQILSMGTIKIASGMTVYGGQFVSDKDIEFTASGNGVRGVSLVANGKISGTTNMDMYSCGGRGMDGNITVQLGQLVQ